MLADLAYRREKNCVCGRVSYRVASVLVSLYVCMPVVVWVFVCVCGGGGEVSALLGFVQVKSPLISCLNALSTKAFG